MAWFKYRVNQAAGVGECKYIDYDIPPFATKIAMVKIREQIKQDIIDIDRIESMDPLYRGIELRSIKVIPNYILLQRIEGATITAKYWNEKAIKYTDEYNKLNYPKWKNEK